ncbi:MAG: hypothetical protein ACYCST_02180 [Acidimicrobiales bacterium]|jgi:hypothetical protein
MADEADRAQQFEQIQLAQSLAFRQNESLPRKGRCHNCNELLPPDALFCDDACEQDFQRLRRMRAQRLS